jgi:hypothetical protein
MTRCFDIHSGKVWLGHKPYTREEVAKRWPFLIKYLQGGEQVVS